MVLIEVVFEIVTEVGPRLVNVAIPSAQSGWSSSWCPWSRRCRPAPAPGAVDRMRGAWRSIASVLDARALPAVPRAATVARAPGAAIRWRHGRSKRRARVSAECAVRERNRCERIHPSPDGRPGKPAVRDAAPPPPRRRQPTLSGELCLIHSGTVLGEKVAACRIDATPGAGGVTGSCGRNAVQAGRRFILTLSPRI